MIIEFILCIRVKMKPQIYFKNANLTKESIINSIKCRSKKIFFKTIYIKMDK